MTTPSGNSQSFSVIIDMLLKGNGDVTETLDAIAKEAKKTGKTLQDLTTEQLEQMKRLADAEEARARESSKNSKLIIQNLRAQAKEIRATVATLKDTAGDIDRFAKPLATGGALVVGGIFAAANKYVNDAKVATSTTIAWKAAQENLNKSGSRIGEILAQGALPILKQAAEVTEKIAGFLERNPGVVEFALKGGIGALAIGTLGKAVAGGIRLYADIKLDAALGLQLRAAQLQLAASENQLAAAGIQSGASKGGAVSSIAKGGGIAGAVASPLGIAAVVLGSVLVAKKTSSEFDKLKESLDKTGGAAETLNNPLVKTIQFLVGLTDPLLKNVSVFQALKEKLAALATQAGSTSTPTGAPSFLGGSPDVQNSIVDAYGKYKEEDLALVKDHYAERNGIIADALAQSQAENSKYSGEVSKIGIGANKAIASATADFNKADVRAEQDYYAERAKTASDGKEEIIKIEQDSQERLAKLRENFEEKSQNATNRRDAFALVDARKEYENQRDEEISNTNKEIASRRKDIALRLRELDMQFRAEQARRLEDYQVRVAEIRAQATEQRKEAAATHAAEIKRIQAEKVEKLKAADEALFVERKKRYAAVIAQLGDLDGSLKAERGIKTAYYNAMLLDATTFINAYKRTLALSSTSSSALPIGIKDAGGYVPRGIYKMSWDGNTEFALTGASTKAMEGIVGGQLTQANIMQAAQGGGRGGGQIVFNNNARYEGAYSADMKRAVEKDIDNKLRELMN